ncbi:MAG: ChbG/HpnK family deacetylase, partial [Clostridia bacterium]|nr:ChbG/HpnK family deacetylase [Clostridia bacterium]
MKLIINADDFGLSSSINRGIVECIEAGIISSTTMMMNTPYTAEAIKMAKDMGLKNVGIHLNLTYGKSVLPRSEVSSLV